MAIRPKKNPVTKIAGNIAKEVIEKVASKGAAKGAEKAAATMAAKKAAALKAAKLAEKKSAASVVAKKLKQGNIQLLKEGDSVKIKPSKYSLFAEDAETLNKKLAQARNATSKAGAKAEKRGLKAANAPLKSKPGSSRAQAQAESNARVSKLYAERKKAFETMKPGDKAPKKTTAEQKFAFRKSMDYGPDGVKTKEAIKSEKFGKKVEKTMNPRYKTADESTYKKAVISGGTAGAAAAAALANEIRKAKKKGK